MKRERTIDKRDTPTPLPRMGALGLTLPPAVAGVDLAEVEALLHGGALHLTVAPVGVSVAGAQGLGVGGAGLGRAVGQGLAGARLHAARRVQAVLGVLAWV